MLKDSLISGLIFFATFIGYRYIRGQSLEAEDFQGGLIATLIFMGLVALFSKIKKK